MWANNCVQGDVRIWSSWTRSFPTRQLYDYSDSMTVNIMTVLLLQQDSEIRTYLYTKCPEKAESQFFTGTKSIPLQHARTLPGHGGDSSQVSAHLGKEGSEVSL